MWEHWLFDDLCGMLAIVEKENPSMVDLKVEFTTDVLTIW
jgi:hypothetical protein